MSDEFPRPKVLYLDDQAGNLTVFRASLRRQIDMFTTTDPQGRPVEILGGPGAAPGQFSNPWSIALDSQGNLLVADSMNHRVQKFIRRGRAS